MISKNNLTITKLFINPIIFVLLLSNAVFVFASDFNPAVKEPVRKVLRVYNVYCYQVQYYKQPLKLKILLPSEYIFNTPEDALQAYVSILYRNDYFDLRAFDSKTAKMVNQLLQNEEHLQRIKEGWKRLYADADFYLIRRVNWRDIVILDFRVEKGGIEVGRYTFNFILEEGQWKFTNKYSDSYVSNYLNSEKREITGNVIE